MINPFEMEITVLSARGLKNSNSLFRHRLRPFITITADGDSHCSVYTTRVDDQGGVNPTWGDKFHVPILDYPCFVSNMYSSCVYLQLYSKRLIAGHTQLGWCRIPVTDFASPPVGTVRYLSYRLRDDRDGTRGQGVINVAIKLVGNFSSVASRVITPATESFAVENWQTVIGIPVMPRRIECSCCCQGELAASASGEVDKLLAGRQKWIPRLINQIRH
jgi:hypothetical protein